MDDEGRSMSPEPESPVICSNSNQSAEKVATESSANETAPSPNVGKAISIKSVMQLNEVQGKPFNTSPMNDEIKATKSNDDSFFDSSAKAPPSDASDSNLDKSMQKN